jgi:hypothetical protein
MTTNHYCSGDDIDMLEAVTAWHDAGCPSTGKTFDTLREYAETRKAANDAAAKELDDEARGEIQFHALEAAQ